MESKRSIERSKLERPLNIRPLKREASNLRVTSIDTTSAGVGFSSMIPLKIGAAVAIDNPDQGKNAMLLCNVKHCTLTNGKFHVGATIEQSQTGSLTTTQIPAEWWKSN